MFREKLLLLFSAFLFVLNSSHAFANNKDHKSCKHILKKAPASSSQVYLIDPDSDGGISAFYAYCDMQTDGGGWTRVIIQNADAVWNAWSAVKNSENYQSDKTYGIPIKYFSDSSDGSELEVMFKVDGQQVGRILTDVPLSTAFDPTAFPKAFDSSFKWKQPGSSAYQVFSGTLFKQNGDDWAITENSYTSTFGHSNGGYGFIIYQASRLYGLYNWGSHNSGGASHPQNKSPLYKFNKLEVFVRTTKNVEVGKPIALADSFTLHDTAGSTELDILANDTDEDKASLTIAITNQSDSGGSATVSAQKLRYSPKAGYTGEDWIEYQLTDKQGLTSEVARVSIILKAEAAKVPRNNLIAEYLFENASHLGLDTSGNNNHATNSGATQADGIKPGKAAQFDGVDDYIKLPDLASVIGANKNFSITAWSSKSKEALQGVFSGGYASSNTDAKLLEFLYYEGNVHASLLKDYGTPNGLSIDVKSSPVALNGKEHTALVYTHNELSIYVSGKLLATRSTKNVDWSHTYPYFLGARGYKNALSDNFFLQGVIDDVRIYSRALDSAEIEQLYTGKIPENKAPQAQADSFSFTNEKSHALALLNNDWDEDKYSVSIKITGQKADAGTVALNGQTVTYTPKVNYVGADWFEYQLTDKHGLKSAIARVTLDVQKYLPKIDAATITPLINLLDVDKQLVTISHKIPGAKIWFQFHNLKTHHVTDFIEYTNPFYIYTSARIVTVVKKEGYRDSDPVNKDYIMCQQTDVCGTSHKEIHFHWWDKQTQKAITKAKVNQPVSVRWEVERVQNCKESTTGHPDNTGRSSNGITPDYRFSQLGNISSRWQCFNSSGSQMFPSADSSDYRTLPLTLEKLDAPTNLTHSQTDSTVTLNWNKVNYASHYQLQYQKVGESNWQTKSVNGLSTSLELASGDYNLKLSGCIPNTCSGVGDITTKIIKVEDNPFVIRKLQWQANPITVGETATLEWDIGNALECFVDGLQYPASASHTISTIFQAGTVDKTLVCRKTAGGNKESIVMPQDKKLKVKKLAAPANLRKQ